eukprot:SAG11_NODE_4577_length_1844_cov_3.705444_1_plen_113_part_00
MAVMRCSGSYVQYSGQYILEKPEYAANQGPGRATLTAVSAPQGQRILRCGIAGHGERAFASAPKKRPHSDEMMCDATVRVARDSGKKILSSPLLSSPLLSSPHLCFPLVPRF